MNITFRQAYDRAAYSIWLWEDDGERVYFAKPTELVFEDRGPSSDATALSEPTFQIGVQRFMRLREAVAREAVAQGLVAGAGKVQGELEASKRHIEDLRKISFELVGSVAPKLASRPANDKPVSPDWSAVNDAIEGLAEAGICERGRLAVRELVTQLFRGVAQ